MIPELQRYRRRQLDKRRLGDLILLPAVKGSRDDDGECGKEKIQGEVKENDVGVDGGSGGWPGVTEDGVAEDGESRLLQGAGRSGQGKLAEY